MLILQRRNFATF